MAIVINIDKLILRRMTSRELAQRTGITEANLSILKTGKAKALRLTTLNALCQALDCQPGDLLEYVPDGPETD
jgi:putative transcriptional regulator